ncbi:hypothetical protein [Methanothrix harundinacea]|uniref:hypothetical protein n=1 Tax=Methanothrix harundinacea TaxID=301375 RepID=UPI001651953F|nr:hypothetical protein [Methanothrix harundinacea]
MISSLAKAADIIDPTNNIEYTTFNETSILSDAMIDPLIRERPPRSLIFPAEDQGAKISMAEEIPEVTEVTKSRSFGGIWIIKFISIKRVFLCEV